MGSHLWVMHSHVNRVRVLDMECENMTKLVPGLFRWSWRSVGSFACTRRGL
jgi:hypothetical protein